MSVFSVIVIQIRGNNCVRIFLLRSQWPYTVQYNFSLLIFLFIGKKVLYFTMHFNLKTVPSSTQKDSPRESMPLPTNAVSVYIFLCTFLHIKVTVTFTFDNWNTVTWGHCDLDLQADQNLISSSLSPSESLYQIWRHSLLRYHVQEKHEHNVWHHCALDLWPWDTKN